ncbi:MAG TPA: pitrilysin family protein [Alphaproteobacteria bacterium]
MRASIGSAARLIATALCLVAAATASAAAAAQIQRVVSPGGIEAWLIEDHTNPIVALRFALRAGAAYDPEGKEGLAEMTAALLDEGAGDLDSQAFQGRLQDDSISLGFDAGMDNFSGGLRTLTRHRAEAFDLLRLALAQPRFDAEAVERIRAETLVAIAREAESPHRIAGRLWWRMSFPDHPYGRPSQGTAESVKSIDRDDLVRFVKQRLARDTLVIGVVGDITAADLAPLLDQTFGHLPAKASPAVIPDAEPANEGEVRVVRRNNPQSIMIFGQRGLKRSDPNFYAAMVMNYILGGGTFNSRLYAEVREKRGLAYSIGTYLSPLDHAGLIIGSVGTRNSQVKQTIDLIRVEWRRMATGDISQAEVDDAKTYLTGSFALQFRNSDGIAQLLVAIQMDRLGIDYIERRNKLIDAVTLEDVKRVAKALLDPEGISFVVVGDPEGLPGG